MNKNNQLLQFKHLTEAQRKELSKAIGSLPTEVQTVIYYRFGLHDNRPMTDREIAKALGKSLNQVRELTAQALEALKGPVKKMLKTPAELARETLGLTADDTGSKAGYRKLADAIGV